MQWHGVLADTSGHWHHRQSDSFAQALQEWGLHLGQNWQKIDSARGCTKLDNSALATALLHAQTFTLEEARALNMHDVHPNSYVQTDSGDLYQPVPQPCPYAHASYDKKVLALGQRWKASQEMPKNAVLCSNAKLECALQTKIRFTPEQVASFGMGVALTHKTCVLVGGKYYTPVVGSGSKIFAWFKSKREFAEEISRTPVPCYYEVLEGPACLYMDFDSVLRTWEEEAGMVHTVQSCVDAVYFFLRVLYGQAVPVDIQVLRGSRRKSAAEIKASFHLIFKNVAFASNVHDKLMYAFVLSVKRLIGDGERVVPANVTGKEAHALEHGETDLEVYTERRSLRPAACAKRQADNATGEFLGMQKVNVDGTAVLDFELPRKHAAPEQQVCNIMDSFVCNVPDHARFITRDDLDVIEPLVLAMRVGLCWVRVAKPSSKAVLIEDEVLSGILATVKTLTRTELDALCARLQARESKAVAQHVVARGQQTFHVLKPQTYVLLGEDAYRPHVTNSSRHRMLKSGKAPSPMDAQPPAKKPRASAGPVVPAVVHPTADAAEATDVELPRHIHRMFCGVSVRGQSTVKRSYPARDNMPAYARELLQRDMARVSFFYITHPLVCPYAKSLSLLEKDEWQHKSQNMGVMRVDHKGGRIETFCFCYDKECREKYRAYFRSVPSVGSFQRKDFVPSLPSIQTSSESKTPLQRIFETPYGFGQSDDADDRRRFLRHYTQPNSANLARAMYAWLSLRLTWMRFLGGGSGWALLSQPCTAADRFFSGVNRN